MGMREWAAKANAAAERNKFNTSYEGYTLSADKIRRGFKSWPVAGANAWFEGGAAGSSRSTATRVGSGAVIGTIVAPGLGTLVGAAAGGMAKKKKAGRLYVQVDFPDGDAILFDVPAKEEAKVRQFVAKVNGASAMFTD